MDLTRVAQFSYLCSYNTNKIPGLTTITHSLDGLPTLEHAKEKVCIAIARLLAKQADFGKCTASKSRNSYVML